MIFLLRIIACMVLLFSQYCYPIYRCHHCGEYFLDNTYHECQGEVVDRNSKGVAQRNENDATGLSAGFFGLHVPSVIMVGGTGSGMNIAALPIAAAVKCPFPPQNSAQFMAEAVGKSGIFGKPIKEPQQGHWQAVVRGIDVLKRPQNQTASKDKRLDPGSGITTEFMHEILGSLMSEGVVFQVIFHDCGYPASDPFYLMVTEGPGFMIHLIFPEASSAPVVFEFESYMFLNLLVFIREKYKMYEMLFKVI